MPKKIVVNFRFSELKIEKVLLSPISKLLALTFLMLEVA